MKKKTVAIVFGGFSPEYHVSLESAYSVITSIDTDKYNIITLGITREGQWFRYYGDFAKVPGDTWHEDTHNLKPAVISPSRGEGIIEFNGGGIVKTAVDVLFPVLHGKCGEDGTVQGLCELAGIPVVGCSSAASALCMDKDRAHKVVSLSGVNVPRSVTFTAKPGEREFAGLADKLRFPLFIKPVKAGSSFGITMVSDIKELSDAFDSAFMFDDVVIAEERIEGFETGCAVVGNTELITGRADEIELSHGFFDFVEKYSLKTSKIHMPARVPPETELRITETAKTIYKALGCRGFARVDMFLTPSGEIYFNEVNTIPGFTSHSRFPNMMRGVGYDFTSLIDKLIELSTDGGDRNET